MPTIPRDLSRVRRQGVAALLLLLAALASPPSSASSEPDAATKETARRFVDAIDQSDGAALSALLDIDAIGASVLRYLDLNPVDRARYLGSLRAQFGTLGQSLATQMRALRAKAIPMRFLPRPRGGAFTVRIDTRDARGNHAHNYLEVEVDERGKIVDWLDHGLAQPLSGQLAFSASGLLTTEQLAAVLFGRGGDSVATATLMQRLSAALAVGDVAAAHATLLEMPERIKARREHATLQMATARAVSMDAYRAALARVAAEHGDADELQFMLIDHYILTGQPEAALAAVDRAAKRIGEDEVMDANRCHALHDLGRTNDALAACDRAIARNPKFHTPRWTRVRIALATKDAKLAVESLDGAEIAEGRPLDPAQLAAMAPYAWLAETPEFAAWGAARGWAPAKAEPAVSTK